MQCITYKHITQVSDIHPMSLASERNQHELEARRAKSGCGSWGGW